MGRDQDQPAGSSLTRLLQPLLAAAPTPTSSVGAERELATVRPLPTQLSTQGIRRELEESLTVIHSQVQAVHYQFQLTRQAATGTGAGHLRLLPPPQSATTAA